ncbi:hypothetical protein R1T15_23745 [Mucilaginibacter sp. L3T2-6]|nr:hypothetical protein [Mucilaginibacter sp. L3T2-6]
MQFTLCKAGRYSYGIASFLAMTKLLKKSAGDGEIAGRECNGPIRIFRPGIKNSVSCAGGWSKKYLSLRVRNERSNLVGMQYAAT